MSYLVYKREKVYIYINNVVDDDGKRTARA